jgi:hypothetical protein
MTKKNFYLSADLDREIFQDESGNIYSVEQVKKLLQGGGVDLTLLAQRLIQQFNYDFKDAREYYSLRG